MGPLELITAGLKAFGSGMDWLKMKLGLNNTPEMQEAQKNQKEQIEDDKDCKDVRTGDVDDTRKRVS